jgi:hypothetical protein
VLRIGNKREKFTYEMREHGSNNVTVLQRSVLEKDLDVNVDSELRFSELIEVPVNEANSFLGMIRRSFEFLSASTMKTLFVALVRPHLEFCDVAWSPKLEKENY